MEWWMCVIFTTPRYVTPKSWQATDLLETVGNIEAPWAADKTLSYAEYFLILPLRQMYVSEK